MIHIVYLNLNYKHCITNNESLPSPMNNSNNNNGNGNNNTNNNNRNRFGLVICYKYPITSLQRLFSSFFSHCKQKQQQ